MTKALNEPSHLLTARAQTMTSAGADGAYRGRDGGRDTCSKLPEATPLPTQ